MTWHDVQLVVDDYGMVWQVQPDGSCLAARDPRNPKHPRGAWTLDSIREHRGPIATLGARVRTGDEEDVEGGRGQDSGTGGEGGPT